LRSDVTIPADPDSGVDDDEISSAPESGQPRGGRENPWDCGADEDAGGLWPAPLHAAPRDEL
jgi:hypothetical protein